MNSQIILAVLVFLAAPVMAQHPQSKDSPLEFVQEFYNWYTPIASKDHKGPAFSIALKRKPSLFSSELIQALNEDATAQEKANGEIVGIDWDPFLYGQDSGGRYVVGKMKQKGDRYFVDVNVILNAKKLSGPHVIAELMKVNGQWTFMNFRYLDSADLLTNLKTLKKERQTPAK
jgi:hypothetical protein